jgi:hypothetical protein
MSASPIIDENQIRQELEKRQKVKDMDDHYKVIYENLSQILSSNNGKYYMDRFQLLPLLQTPDAIPRDKMSYVFKHLLAYTYAATAAEISNHQEVNAQLQEIKETLKKLIKENPKTETPTVPPKGPE